MIKISFYFLLSISLIFICCKKEGIPPDENSKTCKNFIIIDSAHDPINAVLSTERFVFNEDGNLVKHISYAGHISDSLVQWRDSFAYANGNMVKSWLSLGTNNSSNPYTISEYDYEGNKLASSKYYLGQTLMAQSTYITDDKGKITYYQQDGISNPYQYIKSFAYNLNYDENSNLISVSDGSSLPSYTFVNYDDKPNFFKNLQFDYAYNLLDYFPQYFSRNNMALIYSYIPSYINYGEVIPRDSTMAGYTYTYNNDNQLLSFLYSPPNGSASNGPGVIQAKTVQYECK